MAVLVVQLSDLHAYDKDNFVLDKWDALCRAVVSDLHEVDTCVIAFSGDAAWSGKTGEFKEALFLIQTLRQFIKEKFPAICVTALSVPGNHDCDLTAEDLDARITLRKMVLAERAAPSIERILLEPQKNYFQFSADLFGCLEGAISSVSPFYNSIDIKSGARILRFHLVNSAWTSIIHETQDLRRQPFPRPTSPYQ